MPTGLRIDVLCTVIDNFGDAGICWRLARQLVDEARARVTLWIDQPAILDAWRPQGPAITVRACPPSRGAASNRVTRLAGASR